MSRSSASYMFNTAQCGNAQKVCPDCHFIGCDYEKCDCGRGIGTSCRMCGSYDVMLMSTHKSNLLIARNNRQSEELKREQDEKDAKSRRERDERKERYERHRVEQSDNSDPSPYMDLIGGIVALIKMGIILVIILTIAMIISDKVWSYHDFSGWKMVIVMGINLLGKFGEWFWTVVFFFIELFN